MKNLEKKYVNAAFIAAFIILASVNVVTYLNIRIHLNDEAVINEVLTEIQLSESLLSRINEAETSRRGYYITNENVFLQQYYTSTRAVDSLYKRLKKEVSEGGSKSVVDSLGKLIFIRKDILEESIELQELKDKDTKSQIDFTKTGREYQDRIRSEILRFQSIERENFAVRLKEADRSASYTLVNLTVGSVIAYILLTAGLIILNRNMTKRKLIESSLWESRNWFETTLQSIGDGVIVTNKVGDLTFMNKVAEELTAWKEDETKGLMIEHLFYAADKKTGEKILEPHRTFREILNDRKNNSDVILRTKHNDKIHVEFSASRLAQDGQSLGMVYVFRDISERRKAESGLLDSKKFIQRIADSIPSVIYAYGLKELKLNYVNYKIIDLLGYSGQYLNQLGTDFFVKLIHPDDRERLFNLYKKFITAKDSEIISYEYRILNSRGEWRWFKSFDVVFNRSVEGNVQEMLGTAMDVTDQKKLEEEIKRYSGHLEELVNVRTAELQKANENLYKEIQERVKAENSIIEAEEKFRSLVEYTMVGIYIIQDGNFVYVNPKFEEFFGFEPDELIGTYSFDRVHTGDKELVAENMRKRINNEVESVHYTFKGVKKDGSIIDVEVRGTKMLYMQKYAIIGTLMDITERKRYEEALVEQQQFMNTVINMNPNFIFAKDWDGKFTIVNKAVADNYGTSIEELIGKTDADFNNDKDEVRHFIENDREVITSKVPKFIPEEVVTDSKTGEKKWYQTIKIPLETKKGDTQLLGVATDITSRKLADEITKKSLHDKELLLKEIHHRVKNNLQIIVSLLKLQAKYMYDKRDLEHFVNSRSRVETMSMIHERLYKTKDLSNIDLGSYLSDIVGNILKSSIAGKDNYSFNMNDNAILISIDSAIPCGLIINELLLNIIKYSFAEEGKKCIKLNLDKSGEKIIIKVNDNGKGISRALDTSSPDSLGMQLIDMLVKQLDAEMEINNETGTSFELSFKELTYKERI